MRPIVSILVPTRGRPKEFAEMQDSVGDDPRVEILAELDTDDIYLELYPIRFLNTMQFAGPRAWLTKKWNALASEASGDFLMLGNDDMRFGDDYWLGCLLGFNPAYPYVIGFKDGERFPDHFVFPVITRAFYEIQGFFLPEQFQGVYADTWVYDVGRRADCLRPISEYEITHLHWSNQTRQRDATDADKFARGTGGARKLFEETADERQRIADRIKSLSSVRASSSV